MATLTIRRVPDEVHRALRVCAAMHGRSTEAEIRHIIASAVMPPDRVKIGSALFQLTRDAGLTDEEAKIIENARDKAPAQPMSFE